MCRTGMVFMVPIFLFLVALLYVITIRAVNNVFNLKVIFFISQTFVSQKYILAL